MANPGGKGSTPRPLSVSQEQYNERWDAIFMSKKDEKIDMSEKRVENLSEIVQDRAEIHRIFEGDDDER